MYSSTLSLTSALDGGGWPTPRPGRFTPGKDSVPTVEEAGWASGPVRTGTENLSPIGIRSPDRRARSKSLYRLSYPGSSPYNITEPKNRRRYYRSRLKNWHDRHVIFAECRKLTSTGIRHYVTIAKQFRSHNTWTHKGGRMIWNAHFVACLPYKQDKYPTELSE